MSAKVKGILSWVFKGVAALFIVLAFIFMFTLPGASISVTQEGVTAEGYIKMSAFVFGGGNITISLLGMKLDIMSFKGGLSIFGLVAFILLVFGFVLTIFSLALRKHAKGFALFAVFVLLLAGISSFLLTTAGTSTMLTMMGETEASKVSWIEFVDGLHLGSGTIVCGIFSILASVLLFVDAIMFEKHKQVEENHKQNSLTRRVRFY